LINLLTENGVTPIEIIKTKDGSAVASTDSIEGDRFILLTRELPSETVQDFSWSPELWQQFGNKLAKIHQLTRDTTLNRPILDTHQVFVKFAESIISYFGSDNKESSEFNEKLSWLKSSFEILQELSPQGVVHGDYSPLNVVLKDGELGIIDYDYSWIGPQWLDILNITFFSRKYYGEKGLEDIDNFLAGYQQVSTLPLSFIEEIDRLEILTVLYYMGIWSLKINLFGESFITGQLEEGMKVILEVE
jgi:Ser/Thr protein kinase RdoA (MazF antagonist)